MLVKSFGVILLSSLVSTFSSSFESFFLLLFPFSSSVLFTFFSFFSLLLPLLFFFFFRTKETFCFECDFCSSFVTFSRWFSTSFTSSISILQKYSSKITICNCASLIFNCNNTFCIWSGVIPVILSFCFSCSSCPFFPSSLSPSFSCAINTRMFNLAFNFSILSNSK